MLAVLVYLSIHNMSRLFRSSSTSKGKQRAQMQRLDPPQPQHQLIYPQQQSRAAHERDTVGIGVAGGNQTPSSKNPQSGASYRYDRKHYSSTYFQLDKFGLRCWLSLFVAAHSCLGVAFTLTLDLSVD